MDMTKIKFNKGWRYLHVVKDWYNKEIIGWQLSFTSTTNDWCDALNQAVNNRFPWGIHTTDHKPNLITDNGCQPMAKAFKQACDTLGITQIFTSFNNPKGNADTERLMRTIKEDIVWPYDWDNFHDFKDAFKSWVHDYNNDYPHMALNYKTPTQFAQNTLLFAAWLTGGITTTILEGSFTGFKEPRVNCYAKSGYRRWSFRILESFKRGLPQHKALTLLGTQDHEYFK